MDPPEGWIHALRLKRRSSGNACARKGMYAQVNRSGAARGRPLGRGGPSRQEPPMGEVASSPRVVGFGVFEVDLRAGELRRRGVRVRLQEQPLRVLGVLLERPGEVV